MTDAKGSRWAIFPLAVLLLWGALPGEARAGFQNVLVTNLNPVNGNPDVFQFDRDLNSGSPVILSGLSNLRGIAVTPDGNVLVNDLNGNITQFNANGSPASTFATGVGQPYGLAFNPLNGNLYVASISSSPAPVLEYTPTGTPVAFALTGGPGVMNATGLTFDPAGNLYVASSNNAAGVYNVQEFTSTGTYLRTFTAGSLFQPSGIAIGHNTLYVANGDNGGSTITQFDLLTGSYVTATSVSGLNTAGGIAFDPSTDRLFVTSNANSSVLRLDPANLATPDASITEPSLNSPIYVAIAPVPEPTSFGLMALGTLTLFGLSVRLSRRAAA